MESYKEKCAHCACLVEIDGEWFCDMHDTPCSMIASTAVCFEDEKKKESEES